MSRIVTIFVVAAAAWAAEPQARQQQRVQALQEKLLAPCCYEEPVGRHQSEIAVRMRIEIQRKVAEGKSDQEILDAYVARYGNRVLSGYAETPGWARFVPWILLVTGAVWLSWWVRRLVRTPSSAAS